MSYQRSREDKRRLKKLYDETNFRRRYRGGVYFNHEKHRYIKWGVGDKWAKRQSVRAIRRKMKARPYHLQRGASHRLYDYWWTVT